MDFILVFLSVVFFLFKSIIISIIIGIIVYVIYKQYIEDYIYRIKREYILCTRLSIAKELERIMEFSEEAREINFLLNNLKRGISINMFNEIEEYVEKRKPVKSEKERFLTSPFFIIGLIIFLLTSFFLYFVEGIG